MSQPCGGQHMSGRRASFVACSGQTGKMLRSTHHLPGAEGEGEGNPNESVRVCRTCGCGESGDAGKLDLRHIAHSRHKRGTLLHINRHNCYADSWFNLIQPTKRDLCAKISS